jgi:hypothetical protein
LVWIQKAFESGVHSRQEYFIIPCSQKAAGQHFLHWYFLIPCSQYRLG